MIWFSKDLFYQKQYKYAMNIGFKSGVLFLEFF